MAEAVQRNVDTCDTRKSFVPLENNPEVMTSLVHKLGFSKQFVFHDVFSIDEPELLSFLPRPALALLLVFPMSETYEKFRHEEDSSKPEYEGSGPQEPVIWYKQTIRNACGLMGLLHGVSNGQAKSHVEPEGDLAKLIESAVPLKPAARADLLYESKALESAHRAAASTGDTAAPGADAVVDLHYVCFIKAEDNHLWELDGRRKGPLDRGALSAEEDVLSEKALGLGVRPFIKREVEAAGGDSRFSLIALAPRFD